MTPLFCCCIVLLGPIAAAAAAALLLLLLLLGVFHGLRLHKVLSHVGAPEGSVCTAQGVARTVNMREHACPKLSCIFCDVPPQRCLQRSARVQGAAGNPCCGTDCPQSEARRPMQRGCLGWRAWQDCWCGSNQSTATAFLIPPLCIPRICLGIPATRPA